MAQTIMKPEERTLGEFIQKRYPDFTVRFGEAPMDMDISNGIEVDYNDNRRWGYGESVSLYPFVLYTDGLYKPAHYWGVETYIRLEKR